MSGPKEGHYRNYFAECEGIKRRIDSIYEEIKRLENDIRNYSISADEQRLGLEFSGVDLSKERESVYQATGELINSAKALLEQAKRITTYNQQTLINLNQIMLQIQELRDKALKHNISFRLKVSETLKKSREQAERLSSKLINEMELYTSSQDFELISEWASEKQKIQELKNLLNQAKRAELKEVERIHGEFFGMAKTLKEEAIKNRENFELKKDTSSKIMKILAEQNYVNIERKLEDDKLSAVVVVAESPSGGWNLTFRVQNDGEIRVITPYGDRCYNELEQIGESLKSVGVEIRLKQLEERKKEQGARPQAVRIQEKQEQKIPKP